MGTNERTLNGANHACVRYFMQFSIMAIVIKVKNLEFFGPREYFKLLMARGVVGSASIILKFFAIKFIRPSDIAALKNCHVIATTLLAKLFLNEVLTIVHLLSICLTLIGIVCVSRPEFIFDSRNQIIYLNMTANLTNPDYHIRNEYSEYSIIGVILILISSVLLGCTQVILRKLGTAKGKSIKQSFFVF